MESHGAALRKASDHDLFRLVPVLLEIAHLIEIGLLEQFDVAFRRNTRWISTPLFRPAPRTVEERERVL